MRVIARAYGNEPLDRVLVGRSRKLAYVASESALGSESSMETAGVGFPATCVFRFDSALFHALSEAWVAGDHERLASLWADAEPIGSPT
jgi:hypothetical protein